MVIARVEKDWYEAGDGGGVAFVEEVVIAE